MRKNKTWSGKLCLASLSLLAVAPAFGQSCQNPVPVWQDEFNGNALDTSKWDIMLGDGCTYGICGWGNNELQSYKAENLSVDNGTLKITAKKQRDKGSQYTSGRIRTAGMPNGGEWTHGRFEARIKLPNGTGMWPAFWMLPTNPDVGWPESGEIDILEATGQADMIAFGTIHYGQPWPNNEWTSGRILKQPDRWSDDFHEYAVEWEPGEIRWYVNDTLYSVKTPADLSDPAFWTFDNYSYHFLLNLAVGGSIGGVVDDSMLPQTMEVDYVRVYDFGQPSLSGQHIVEPNTQVTYRVVDEVGNNSSYSWSAPTGQTGTTSSFTVDWAQTGGPVSVAVSNSCGSYQLVMDVHVSPQLAQEQMLDDFDSNRNVTYTYWDGQFNPSQGNPSVDAVNGSPTVAEYGRNPATRWDVIAMNSTSVTDVAPFIAGNKAFYLDVYMQSPQVKPLLIQLENSNTATPDNYPTGRHSKFIAHTEAKAGWQRLKFTLEDRIDGGTSDTQVDSLVLLIDPDSSNADTYYLDNLAIYGTQGSGPEPVPSSIHVGQVSTGTQAAGKGQKNGQAQVTVMDDLGNPVANVSVTGQFSGSWSEAASGVTDASGTAVLQTSTALGGNVTVNFCVDGVSGTLPHNEADSSGLCAP